MDPIIQVAVVAFPDGSTAWVRSDPGVSEYVQKLFAKFREEHPEYQDTAACGGMILIRMPESRYNAIPATSATYVPA